jgi:hypothetical protein
VARFLLDEQISPRGADLARRAGVDVVAVAGSSLAGRDDADIFGEAVRNGRIVVTYDIADFAGLYGDLWREGVRIPGLVFVDQRSIPSSDVGGLAGALVKLAAQIDRGRIDPAAGVYLHG